MTYRERRERRAERLRDWADKREHDAAAVHRSHERFRGDVAFNTQPGHIPLRARVIAQTERALESEAKARDMSQRADEIERQAEGSIYSDDADAPERLRERIAALEAERERVKRYNASARKAGGDRHTAAGDLSLLDVSQRENVQHAARIGWLSRTGGLDLTNLTANIARNRKRLAEIERERTQGPRERRISARYAGTCAECGAEINRGDTVAYSRRDGARCVGCAG